MLNLLLAEGTVADWISKSFPIIQTILIILVTLAAVVIIIAVLIQPSKPGGGSNVVTGVNESYYSHNKSQNREGRLNKIIIICAITIVVLTILYFISFKIYNG